MVCPLLLVCFFPPGGVDSGDAMVQDLGLGAGAHRVFLGVLR